MNKFHPFCWSISALMVAAGVLFLGAALVSAEDAKPKFLPVSITASPVEIELPNGGLVRLPVGVGQAVIVDVVEAVSALRGRRRRP